MSTNDFGNPFATGGSAVVLTQAEWLALLSTTIANGFSTGIADPATCNKLFRQAAFVAAALTQLTSDTLTEDVLDNGVLSDLQTQLSAMILAVGGGGQSLKSMQTVTNSTRASVTGSVANTYTSAISGTLTKASASSTLAVWLNIPSWIPTGDPGASLMKLTIGGVSKITIVGGTSTGYVTPASTLSDLFSGITSGSVSWSIAFARPDNTAWTHVANPSATDVSGYTGGTTTTLMVGEIEP